MRSTFTAAIAASALLAFGSASAQGSYPNKPIHFVVPFTAGSGTDVIARTVGAVMGRDMARTSSSTTGRVPAALSPQRKWPGPSPTSGSA
ncbi:MAG: hypothetical protein M3Y55_01140 [Pseudomonadota bacterium]|nr:hypothetical protein [Pseudomonadota bacterium]